MSASRSDGRVTGRRALSVAAHLALVVALVLSPVAPFVGTAQSAANADSPLTPSARHAITAYVSDSERAYVPEPVLVGGEEYVVAYVTEADSGSRLIYSGNLDFSHYPRHLAYDTDWASNGLRSILIFELTEDGARLVPQDESELIRRVVRTQAATSWRQYQQGRPDHPISWVAEFQEGMLYEGAADVAFGWEKLTGFKSREDRYLAALQEMTTTSRSDDRGYIPEDIEEDVTSAGTAVQSADTAVAAANELAEKNYVWVDGELVDADVAETALRGYADDITYVSERAGDAGFAASLSKLVLAISEEKAYNDRKVQMLAEVQEYSREHPEASLDPALDGAITRLRNQHENTDLKTKQAIVTWLQEEGLGVGQYTAEKLAPKFGSWLVSNSQYASSYSSLATSNAANTALSGASKAAGIVGVAKAGWDLGGVVGGRSATYGHLKKAEFSRLAMQDFRRVRNDVTNRYGDDLSGSGEYARADAAAAYHASEYLKQRSLAEFYHQAYATTQATYFDDIVNEAESVYNLVFGGNGVDNEQEQMREYARLSMKKAEKIRTTSADRVLDRYPDAVGTVPPSAALSVSPTATKTGQTVQFDASDAFDTDGQITDYRWDFDGDGSIDETTAGPKTGHTYDSEGSKRASVTVVDDDGATADATTTVTVARSVTELSVDRRAWDIGRTLDDGVRRTVFTVTNTGDVPTGLSVARADGLSASGVPNRLSPGESASVTVDLDASEYEGDPVVFRHDSGKTVVPVGVTVVSDDERIDSEDDPLSDDDYDCFLLPDLWGDGQTFCGETGREWSDSAEVDEDHYDGLDSATLDISFRPGGPEEQDDPLRVFVNGHRVATFDSPSPDSAASNDYVERSVPVPLEYLNPGDNEVTMTTADTSSYDIDSGFDDTRLRYTYFEEPDLELETKEFEDQVSVGDEVRIPVVVRNDGGRAAENVRLGVSGDTDDAVEIVEWPDGFGVDDSRRIEPKQSRVGYFVVRLQEDTAARVEFAAISDTDDDDTTITLRPPNGPPVLESRDQTPESGTVDDDFDYTVALSDPDDDTVAVTLEVSDPSDGGWTTVNEKPVGDGRATWTASSFDAADEGAETRYRFRYDDGNGYSGTWGPFAGPTLTDSDTAGPSISRVSYPDVVDSDTGTTVTATITDPSDVERASVSYRFGDDSTGRVTMQNTGDQWSATIPAAPSGVDTISFTVSATDGDGSPATATAPTETIDVRANARPEADAGPDRAVEDGETVTLDATNSADPDGTSVSYSWVQLRGPDAPVSDATTATPSLTVPAAEPGTNLTYQLVVTDDAGAVDTESVTLTVEERSAVTLSVGTDLNDTAAIGERVAFDADVSGLASGESVERYEWRFADGDAESGQSPTHRYVESGTYSVTVTAVTTTDETYEGTTDVTVAPTFADVPPLGEGVSTSRNGVYELPLSAGQSVGLQTDVGSGLHTSEILLYGPDGALIQSETVSESNGPFFGTTATRDGTFYVAVDPTREPGATTPPTHVTPVVRDPDASEPNQDRRSATPVEPNATLTNRTLTESDGDDWYAVTLDGAGTVSATAELTVFNRYQGDVSIRMYDSDGTPVGTVDAKPPTTPYNESTIDAGLGVYVEPEQSVTVDDGGTYYVRVEGVDTDGLTEYDLTVTTSTDGPTPDPVCEGCEPPQDLDGDGTYEDVNGNGVVGFGDVVTLFEQFRSDAVTDDADLYDYNGNGVVGFGDVISLFESI